VVEANDASGGPDGFLIGPWLTVMLDINVDSMAGRYSSGGCRFRWSVGSKPRFRSAHMAAWASSGL
jgi:hypothetical protein